MNKFIRILSFIFSLVILIFLVASTTYAVLITRQTEEDYVVKACSVVENLVHLTNEQFARGEYRDVWKAIYPLTKSKVISQYVITNAEGALLITDLNQSVISSIGSRDMFVESLVTSDCVKMKSSGTIVLRVPFQFISKEDPNGYIYFKIDKGGLAYNSLLIFSIAASVLILAILISAFAFLKFTHASEMTFLSANLSKILAGEEDLEVLKYGNFESFKKILKDFKKEFNLAQVQLKERISIEEANRISIQVAHDIRSPLSALNITVFGLSEISEERRHLILNSVQRINDIANDLLVKRTAENKEVKLAAQVGDSNILRTSVNLFTALEKIINEKKIQYSLNENLIFSIDINSVSDIRVAIAEMDLARIISNIINNAVEAFGKNGGNVAIVAHSYSDTALISITDNGSGMSSQVLELLGKGHYSYGKENSPVAGTGLGVFDAKINLAKWSGSLNILSKVDVGTCVEIRIPLAN